MIPKKIHYCWFGGNPKPKLAEKCIKSWKKYCPDYELVEWNETTFDIDSAPLFVRQAFESKKWAFITDYVRLWAMYNYGGIYMDTDVEVVKPLDRFLSEKAFSGFESSNYVPTGIMASEKDNPVIGELLSYYDDRPFIVGGEMCCKPNTEIITEYFLSKGLKTNNQLQTIDGFTLFPNDFFCPKSINDGIIRKTENTYCIHHFDASWLSDSSQKAKLERWKKKQKKARRKKIRAALKGVAVKILGDKLYSKLRKGDK